MPNVESVKRDIQALGKSGQEAILKYLEEVVVLGSFATEVTNEVKENRFSKGKVCPYCEHDEVSRNGKYNGNQRYICKSCQKTFTDFTRSPHYNSKKDIKSKNLLIQSHTCHSDTKLKDFRFREAIYI